MIAKEKPSRTTQSPPRKESLRGYCRTLLRELRPAQQANAGTARAIGLTSCYRGEGVTTIATLLAVEAAENGQRVLLVDANLAHPAVDRAFEVDSDVGLAEVLSGQAKLADAIRTTAVTGLAVMPAGKNLATIAEPLRLRSEVLDAAGDRFDLVIVDLPPISAAECADLSTALDGVLLVVEAERVRWEAARRMTQTLTRAGAKWLGSVLNKRRRHVPGWLYRRI